VPVGADGAVEIECLVQHPFSRRRVAERLRQAPACLEDAGRQYATSGRFDQLLGACQRGFDLGQGRCAIPAQQGRGEPDLRLGFL
jgi:hypothetical protein